MIKADEITKKAELMKKHFSIYDALEDTKWAANTILELQQQNKELQERLSWYESAVHTCHDECQKPMCIQRRDLEQVKVKNQKLVECVKFYGEPEHWTGYDEENGFLWLNKFTPEKQDYENLQGTVMTAGKLARCVLKEIGEA